VRTPNADSRNILKIYGHISAMPESYAQLLNGSVSNTVEPECDAAIFIINPAAGIDNATIEIWQGFNDFLTPRLVLVTVLEGMEMDFDDAVLLANRVFDQLLTPYLVLHNETGAPTGLISLSDLTTRDYSTTPPTVAEADEELVELVTEFRDEYLELLGDLDESAFATGIIFPAIPVNTQNGMGLDIVDRYLQELPSSS
jgi:hypothetical protein